MKSLIPILDCDIWYIETKVGSKQSPSKISGTNQSNIDCTSYKIQANASDILELFCVPKFVIDLKIKE